LDAIKLSTTNCADAACAQAAGAIGVFDFVAGVVYNPGTQRAPADAKLFGTGPTGTTVNNTVATLGLFDAVSSTGPDAAGFLSLGDNGSIAFNLTSAISTAGLYLYIGEVGDNGEVAGSNIELRHDPVPGIPEPSTYALMLAGLGAVGWLARRQRRG
ncbi:MAG TPA: PEP-CTERM sorting domain-containing protein, partial [Burkholderiaceae bacterium]|nr:PEP-CTERM sorting domain-containing protein [Burkholderiaceae bacterium]